MQNHNKKKRYYWFKLTEDFLNSDKVDYLITLGFDYVILYQCLCLRFINTDGKSVYVINDKEYPMTISKLQRDLKYFTKEQIEKGLEIFKDIGLIYRLSEDVFQIRDFERLVGSETYGAIERREAGDRQKDRQTDRQNDRQ